IQYPTLGSLVSKELGSDDAGLPNFVSIATSRIFGGDAYSAGFLGPKFAPLIVGEFNYNRQQGPNDVERSLKVQDLAPPDGVTLDRFDARVELLKHMQQDFIDKRPGVAPKSHQTAYLRAVKLMRTAAQKVFNIEEEPANVRDAYGR